MMNQNESNRTSILINPNYNHQQQTSKSTPTPTPTSPITNHHQAHFIMDINDHNNNNNRISTPPSSFPHNKTLSTVNVSLSDLLANAALVSNFLDNQNRPCSMSDGESLCLPPEARINNRITQLNQDLEKELSGFQPQHGRDNSTWSNRLRRSMNVGSWYQKRSSRISPDSDYLTDSSPTPIPSRPSRLSCIISVSLILILILAAIVLSIVFALKYSN